MADIIDINVYETVETVDITVEPNLTTININSVTGGGAVTSVNGQTGEVVIATSDNNFTNTLKTKLDGIASGAEVNVNADWNATSGDAQILNKPTIPTAVTQTSQLTNNGADGTNPFVTALDVPIYGQSATLVREVRNTTGATLTKGTVVYINGANGNKPTAAKALATTDALSARTFGLLQTDLANNTNGYVVVIGDLSGLNTSAFTEGVQLYLSGTVAGAYTATKTLAPTHLVYVGKVTRAHPTQGQIEVQIQNGYELEEIHDVQISSLADKQLLSYDLATDLWKNKSVTTADIADSTDKRYQTDNQKLYNDATSSIQTQLNNKKDFTTIFYSQTPILPTSVNWFRPVRGINNWFTHTYDQEPLSVFNPDSGLLGFDNRVNKYTIAKQSKVNSVIISVCLNSSLETFRLICMSFKITSGVVTNQTILFDSVVNGNGSNNVTVIPTINSTYVLDAGSFITYFLFNNNTAITIRTLNVNLNLETI